MTIPNTPVPDELAQVRDEIARLEARGAELRQILLSDPSSRTGANWLAEIREVEQSRTDLRELKAMYPAIAAEFTFPTKVTRVELRGIDQDTGEIVSARKARSAAP